MVWTPIAQSTLINIFTTFWIILNLEEMYTNKDAADIFKLYISIIYLSA